MTREDLEAYIHNQFEDTTTNTPWTQFPHYKVFRHQGNHKWFALVMNITTDKLGWSNIRPIDVLNHLAHKIKRAWIHSKLVFFAFTYCIV